MVLISDIRMVKSFYHVNIYLTISMHFVALEDTSTSGPEISEPPSEAGKCKSSKALDAPLSKRPCAIRRDVPSLRVDRSNSEHAMPVIISPPTRQQALYLVEGFRVWTYGVQSITTVVTWNLQLTSHAHSKSQKLSYNIPDRPPYFMRKFTQEAVQEVLLRCVLRIWLPIRFLIFALSNAVVYQLQ